MPKIVDKEEKKRIIIEAATREFAEKGVGNTKIIDIARRANIGKGTVYEYFSSKEAIFMETMNFFMTSINETVQSRVENISDPKEKIIGLIDAFVESAESMQELLTIILDFWSVGLRGEQIGAWQQAYKMFQSLISSILDEGIEKGIFRDINKEYCSLIIIGLLDGIVFQVILFKKEYDMAAARDAAIDAILNGFLKR